MQKSSAHSFAYIAVFLLIISVIVYLNLVFQENLKKDISVQFNRQQILLARGASLSIERQIDHYVKHLGAISQIQAINELDVPLVRKQLLGTMLDEYNNDPTTVTFQLIDRRGVVRLDRSAPRSVGADVSDEAFFQKTRQMLRGEVYISDMMRMEELNPSKRYIIIATPLYARLSGGPASFNGVALFAVSVDDVAGDYVSQIRMGERGYAWVMDSHGTLVYHPTQPEMRGRNLFKADRSCFSCHRSFDAEKKILEGGATEYGIYTAPLGEDKLISYSRARVGKESWLVCVTTPYSEVTGLIAKSMKLYSMLISIIFFTVIGTSVFFIVLIKKKTAADERARYTAELEDKIRERTRELSREKEKLNAILSGFGAGVSLIDGEYNVQWANEVITQSASNPVGARCYAAYRGLDAPCEGCPLPEVVSTGRMGRAEVVCRTGGKGNNSRTDLLARLTDEGEGYFQIVIAPIKNREGRVVQAVELIQDITGMRKLEQQMMHSEKLAALGRMTAGIAHEIGNPLTSIYSYIQILQDNKYDEFTNSTLDTISFHINRIKGILQEMSGFSRSYQVEKEPVDVNDAVKSAVDLMYYEKGMKGCQLSIWYDPKKLTVMADEKWLVSVFVNLILNSLDAMSGQGTLSVHTHREERTGGGASAVVEISDTGVGIEPENIGRIFDPFFTTKQTGKGTGLGLAVSYNIIKDLKGDISVASRPGEGATFTIRLPITEGVSA